MDSDLIHAGEGAVFLTESEAAAGTGGASTEPSDVSDTGREEEALEEAEQVVSALETLLDERDDRDTEPSREEKRSALEKRFRFAKAITRGGNYFRSLRHRPKRFRFGKSISAGNYHYVW